MPSGLDGKEDSELFTVVDDVLTKAPLNVVEVESGVTGENVQGGRLVIVRPQSCLLFGE